MEVFIVCIIRWSHPCFLSFAKVDVGMVIPDTGGDRRFPFSPFEMPRIFTLIVLSKEFLKNSFGFMVGPDKKK
ncbi:hypothetical protein CEXT_178301 [Caerostris extrusa]|uniref:Uncharacterized protein n=1 Tax=Caerostris extrusa TaxID=172846 RepID=A0AAV4QNK0_CAEEX|nr:hypothetical protein CEXT_178301 [Caerostris extrusa]